MYYSFSLIFLLCGAASPAAAAGTGRFFRGGFFRAAGIKKTRYTLPAALFADFVGFLKASWTVKWFF